MKELFQKLPALLLLAIPFLFVACGSDDEIVDPPVDTPMNIVDIAAADAQFSTLVAALTQADLVSVLEGDGPFTVFAPTNAAFTAAGIDLSTISDEALKETLLYHVIGATIKSTDLADNAQTYASSSAATGPENKNLSLLVERAGDAVTVNSAANVTTANVEASNGVIHIVDQVLTPVDVVDHAINNGGFTSLVAALTQADLVTTLQGAGPFTVFAPTDAAFAAAGIDLSTIADEALEETLLYHVIGGAAIGSTDLADNTQTYTTTAAVTGPGGTQLSVMVTRIGDAVTANGSSNVVVANIVGTNGIIHVIDEVLTPPTVVNHALNNDSFDSLVSTLGAASGDLVNVLSGEGPFTVFAPVNSAFDAVSTVTAGLDDDQLATVLTYHVVNGNILASDIMDGMEVTTVNGEIFTISTTSGVNITDENEITTGVSNVVLTDVQGTNGVVHVIDAVLVPMNL